MSGVAHRDAVDPWEPPENATWDDLPTDLSKLNLWAMDRPELPDDPEPGEYRCPECGGCVTVGPSGDEYGHAHPRNGGDMALCSRHLKDGGDASA